MTAPSGERLLAALNEAAGRLQAVELEKSEPIAIVGLGCRLPGASSPAGFWQLLRQGRAAISELPEGRFDLESYYDPDPDARGKIYVRHGGFVDDVDRFDAAFFGISPREAMTLDPQQRLLLEVSWEALEQANIVPRKLYGSQTGVFIGISSLDYGYMLSQAADAENSIDAYLGTGNSLSVAAGRLAFLLGLTGPCMSVDTACSSSLVAVHLACQSLRRRECRQALVGGVNVLISPSTYVTFCRARMLAPDGRCKTFDAAADGYVRGEGCGVLVCKRLSDAEADGDRILALVRGSAINQDGASAGLTVPSGPSQQAVIRAALAEAKLEPAAVQYIEAHGTGTSLGDPIEIGALGAVFGGDRDAALRVGSAKTNIGHLEAAAGVAGLIKVVLSLQNEELPPHLHLREPSPHIPWSQLSLRVPTELESWPRGDTPRIAGVSSFGFSGTNGHVLLQEPEVDDPPRARDSGPGPLLLAVSAKTEPALQELSERYLRRVEAVRDQAELADLGHCSQVGRSHFEHRLCVLGESKEELERQLLAASREEKSRGLARGRASTGKGPRTAFLFTGQGSQYAYMGHGLYQAFPEFRATVDRCDEIHRSFAGESLLDVLFPAGSAPEGADRHQPSPQDLVHQTRYTQPALFAVELALARLYVSLGLRPVAVFGHSVGELAAACLTRLLSLEDGLRLITERARLMQESSAPGAMAAVQAGVEDVGALVAQHPSRISIAAINGPEQVVISGETQTVQQLSSELESRGRRVRALAVTRAFHSPLMDPILDELERAAASVTFGESDFPLVGGVTGTVTADIATPGYWRRQARQPVQFHLAVNTLSALGVDTCLEIGPKPTLASMASRFQDGVFLPSLRPGRGDRRSLLDSLARLHVRGTRIDWHRIHEGADRRPTELPTYAFQRRSYWAAGEAPAELFAGANPYYEVRWRPSPGASRGENRDKPRHCLVFTDESGLGSAVCTALEARDIRVTRVRVGRSYQTETGSTWSIDAQASEDYERLLSELGTPPDRILHMWSLDAETATPDSDAAMAEALRRTVGSALHLVRALVAARIEAPLCFATRGAAAVEGFTSRIALSNAALWGLAAVVSSEHRALQCRLVDLDPGAPDAPNPGLRPLADAILDEVLNPSREQRVAWREGRSLVPRLVPCEVPGRDRPQSELPALDPESAYLITGGLGALGSQVARWMVDRGARHLVLVGRSAEDDSKTVQALRQAGATIDVQAMDVGDPAAVASLVAGLQAGDRALRGVVHAAGVLDDGALSNQDWSRFESVLHPKAMGAWVLDHLLREQALDFFVVFSSVASLVGPPGQGNYAAANAFCDALAHRRRLQGLPALSINWGPWSVGMAARTAESTSSRATSVFSALKLRQGRRCLDDLVLARLPPQIAATLVDWPRVRHLGFFLEPFGSLLGGSFLDEVATSPGAESEPKRQSWSKLPTLPEPERKEALADYLGRRVMEILNSPEPPAPEQSVWELGFDSLMAMELVDAIKEDLNLMVYPRELYEQPSIAELAPYLSAELQRQEAPSSQAAAEVAVPASATAGLVLPPESSARLPGIVFILSSPRSGSTLLRVMLAGHEALFSPPELHLLPFPDLAERRRQLQGSYLDEGLQRAFMALRGIDADEGSVYLDELTSARTSIQEVYRRLQALADGRILVDKSPTYAMDPTTLSNAERLFDNARYIQLLRHPYAMIESFARMRMDRMISTDSDRREDGDPHRLAEKIWLQSHRNIETFFEREVEPERHHRIRFEDLCAAPRLAMEELCAFLDLPFSDALLHPYRGDRMTDGTRSRSRAIGDPNFQSHKAIDSALGEAWKKIELPYPLGAESAQAARDLGYSLPGQPAADNPPEMAGRRGLACEPSTRPEVARQPIRESFLDVGGQRLCLCSSGPDDAPLVLCVHGIFDQGAAWQWVGEQLVARGFRVVAPDLRGHGRSAHVGTGASYSFGDFLADLGGIVDAIGAPDVLIGHSMGASLAAVYAAVRPEAVSKLVLVEMALPSASDPLEQLARRLGAGRESPSHDAFPDPDRAAEALRRAAPGLSEKAALALAQRGTRAVADGRVWCWDPALRSALQHGLGGALGRTHMLELLGRITASTLLVRGARSGHMREQDAEAVGTSMPAGRWLQLDGSHNLHLDAAAPLAEAIAGLAASNDQ